MNRRGFTLIEMLVATVVAAVLTAGVLLIVSALSRDRAFLASTETTAAPSAIVALIRRDLTNAQAMASSRTGDSLVLVGNCGIDPATLTATGRMSRVAYRVVNTGGESRLVREQWYIDDRVGTAPWRDVVARDVKRLNLTSAGREIPAPPDENLSRYAAAPVRSVPSRVLLRVERSEATIEEELWVR